MDGFILPGLILFDNFGLFLCTAKSGQSGHPIPEQTVQGYRMKLVS
jgi:hypothetical protein